MSALCPCCWQQRKWKEKQEGWVWAVFLQLSAIVVSPRTEALLGCVHPEPKSTVRAAALGCGYQRVSTDMNHGKGIQSPCEISTDCVSPTGSLGT